MNYVNRNIINIIKEERYNNIIYYDENIDYLNSLNKDIDIFERYTNGAFILCRNIKSFELIRNEILMKINRDKRITFNLITTGSKCEKVITLNVEKELPFYTKKKSIYFISSQI